MTSGVVRATVIDRRHARPPLAAPSSTVVSILSAAVALVLIGLALFLDRAIPVGPYLPIALYLSGLALLAGTGGLYAWRSALAPVRPAAGPTTVPAASPRAEVHEDARPTRRLHLALLHGGAEWRVPSDPRLAAAGGRFSWLGREHRRLGVEAAGFAFSGGYSAGQRGGLVAIPLRRDSWTPLEEPRTRPVVAPTTGGIGHSVWEGEDGTTSTLSTDDGIPGFPPSTSREFTDEELDQLFPPYRERSTRILSEAPMRVGFSSASLRELATERPGRRWGAVSSKELVAPETEPVSAEETEAILEDVAAFPLENEGPARDRPFLASPTPELPHPPELPELDLELEAINPVPPHLRLGFPLESVAHPQTDPRHPRSGGAKAVCASCSVVVVNLRLSGPCPKCLRPICTDCLREGLRRYGRGWCEDCARDVRLGAS